MIEQIQGILQRDRLQSFRREVIAPIPVEQCACRFAVEELLAQMESLELKAGVAVLQLRTIRVG